MKKAWACGQHRLYEPSTFILSFIHNLITSKEPQIQRAGNHACYLHTAWLCQLFSAWTWDASVHRIVSFLPELIWWSWVWADCTSCGPMNIVTIITSQLWDEEVAWLSKTFLLHSSFQLIASGIHGWLENSDNSLLVGFQRNSTDSAEDSRESGEILTKEINYDHSGNFDYLQGCPHNYLKHPLRVDWDTRKWNKPHEWKLAIRPWPT